MEYNHWSLLQHVSLECVKHGVKFVMSKYGSKLYSGYFDHSKKELYCSMKHSLWPAVLAHEYCHMQQWLEDYPLCWDDMKPLDQIVFSDDKQPAKLFEAAAAVYQDLELDCEKRAVEVVKEYKLMDPKEYIKRANAYVYFYNFYRRYKKWGKGRSPSRVPQILAIMPDHFVDDYSVSPPGYNELVWKYCI